MTKLYFIRHGHKEKTEAINPLFNHTDPSLSPEGFLDAQKLVNYFNDKQIDYIYSSEYLRANQTALPLATKFQLPIVIDKRLNEIDNGLIETLSDDEIKTQYPEFWTDFFSHKKDVRFPGGENGKEVFLRQQSLLDELKTKDGTSVLFCHEGYIRILVCNILQLPPYMRYRFYYDYCGITELILENNEWMVMRFNQTT